MALQKTQEYRDGFEDGRRGFEQFGRRKTKYRHKDQNDDYLAGYAAGLKIFDAVINRNDVTSDIKLRNKSD